MRTFVIVLLILMPCLTLAHEVRPGYLEIKENADHTLLIIWKQPVVGEYGVPLYPYISTNWMIDSLAKISYTDSYLIKRWKIYADRSALDQQTLRIDGLEKTITDVLVQISLLNNISFTYLIKPIKPYVQLNLTQPQAPPVWQYVQLGIHHIWLGFDHLLFVLGVLLLVKDRTTLVWTITSFTVAHSITLALATFHIVSVLSAFTEAAIALSILFLAVELVYQHRGKNGLTSHYPWLVAFLFGLLHGLGFAGALQNVGLPENNITLALFLFNVGVELGQLAFVIVILLLIAGIKRLPFTFPSYVSKVPAYTIGTFAMFWFVERITMLYTNS